MPEGDTLTLYICADATLTYGPIGGTDKIIPQALPLCTVADALGEVLHEFPLSWDRADLDTHPVFAGEGSLFL